MTHVRVKPAREGEALHHPLDGPLAAEGGKWRRDQFTFKRLRDRDVVEIDEDGKPVLPPEAESPADADAAAAESAKAALPQAGKGRGSAAQSPGPSAADTPKE